jgi:hypothetical protein
MNGTEDIGSRLRRVDLPHEYPLARRNDLARDEINEKNNNETAECGNIF